MFDKIVVLLAGSLFASKGIALLVFCVLASSASVGSAAPLFFWKKQQKNHQSLSQRFPAPRGAKRPRLRRHSFAWWLRRLPLLPPNAPVMLFNGRQKRRQDVHAAVVDLDIGKRDLQQCADVVMRLWGEYLWTRKLAHQADFHLLSGMRNPWVWWARGDRIRVDGETVIWRRRVARKNSSYANYQRYLRFAMAWANTSSLVRQLRNIPIQEAQPGDLLLQGWRDGQYGHAVLLLDIARDKQGRAYYLLGQSYMPAQSFHILRNPEKPHTAWFTFPYRGTIQTPEWTFTTRDLFRLPHTPTTQP
ncbi:DUF4846 domain-containing protein [Myxococcota bacterium]|nr:DUF4846 domain-containing protein [Myxococcota bacterium]